MAEQFHGVVCWNPSRALFNSSPCSYDIGSLGWINNPHGLQLDITSAARSISDDNSDTSVVIQDPHHHHPAGDGHVSVASTLDMTGINLSPDVVWNQGFLGRSDENNYPQIDKNYYQDSYINDFRQMNQHQPLNSPSYLLQTLFDEDFSHPSQSLSDNRATNYSPSSMNLSEILPNLTETLPMVKPNSLPKRQPGNRLQFTNDTPFWNATAAVNLPSAQPQFRPPSLANTKHSFHQSNPKNHNKEAPDFAKKTNNESVGHKRARVETPSPLPAFKVRKEKLGDRITALQQLVSPFGKTDTASVLQEAIEYIKFLHDQVNVLSAPYLKNGSHPAQHHQVADDHNKDMKGLTKDLSSRGLCLAPISSTFPVASETSSDFWTPTFGGGFR